MKKILVPLVFSIAVSACTPAIEPREANLGKESSSNDLQKAIDDALTDITIGDAKINQYVTYEDNVRVELGEDMRSRLIKHTLTDIKEDDQTVRFVMFEDRWHFNLGTGAVIDEKHSEIVIPFQKSLSPQKYFSKNLVADDQCDGRDVTDEKGLVYDCIKYFNLTSERHRVKPPSDVKNKPNCMGLQDCLMDIHFLKYDQVKWRFGKSVHTMTVTAEIAREVPDLMYELDDTGRIISTPPVKSLCLKGNQNIDGRTYLVTQCTVLRDFQ